MTQVQKSRSKEYRKKMSDAKKNVGSGPALRSWITRRKNAENNPMILTPFLGKHHSLESRKKNSDTHKELGSGPALKAWITKRLHMSPKTCECGWQSNSGYIHFCHCNCGSVLVQKYWYIPKFLPGHSNKGENNGMWVGDDVTKGGALHMYIRRNKPRPLNGKCEKCNEKPFYDAANIRPDINPETYTRDFDNWWWACRSCHMNSDGRMKKLERFQGVI